MNGLLFAITLGVGMLVTPRPTSAETIYVSRNDMGAYGVNFYTEGRSVIGPPTTTVR